MVVVVVVVVVVDVVLEVDDVLEVDGVLDVELDVVSRANPAPVKTAAAMKPLTARTRAAPTCSIRRLRFFIALPSKAPKGQLPATRRRVQMRRRDVAGPVGQCRKSPPLPEATVSGRQRRPM